MDKFKELVTTLSNLKNYCDVIRIVDPIRMLVVEINDEKITYRERKCYGFWDRKRPCENCIAMRALNENETFMKIEYINNRVYNITASPFEVDGQVYIVEILKDITDTGIVFSREKSDRLELLNVIAKMNKLVITDELTGVFNRRYINEKLPMELLADKAPLKALALIMCDIDYFKDINDTYGHIVGDYVLKEVASIISGEIEAAGGWTGRYGGEEFLSTVNCADEKEAYDIAERIRTNVEKHNFVYEDKNIKITASFGVYVQSNENIDSISALEKVDNSLYEAKKTGRNRVALSKE